MVFEVLDGLVVKFFEFYKRVDVYFFVFVLWEIIRRIFIEGISYVFLYFFVFY